MPWLTPANRARQASRSPGLTNNVGRRPRSLPDTTSSAPPPLRRGGIRGVPSPRRAARGGPRCLPVARDARSDRREFGPRPAACEVRRAEARRLAARRHSIGELRSRGGSTSTCLPVQARPGPAALDARSARSRWKSHSANADQAPGAVHHADPAPRSRGTRTRRALRAAASCEPPQAGQPRRPADTYRCGQRPRATVTRHASDIRPRFRESIRLSTPWHRYCSLPTTSPDVN
jgi:hypothetical protein